MENINFNLEITYDNDDEYQECLKQVYNINTDNDDEMFTYMSNRIVILKDKMKHLEEIVHLCNLSAKMLLSEELEIGFLLLHSYDYFELFYKLYCNYFKTNEIDKTIYEKLLEKLK